MKIQIKIIYFLIGMLPSLTWGSQAFSFGNCPQGHCSLVDSDMNEFCKANGMAGKPYLVFGPNGEKCYCPCSCVDASTLMTLSDGISELTIAEVKKGEDLASPLSSRESNRVSHVVASDLSMLPSPVKQITFANGAELIVSFEHTFVAPDNKVLAAEQLRKGMEVVDQHHEKTTVLTIRTLGDYRGTLMNIIVNEPSQKTRDHFVVTNSILSGDLLVQSHYARFKTEIDARLGRLKTLPTKNN